MVDPRDCVRFQGGVPHTGPPGTPEYRGGEGFGGVGLDIDGTLARSTTEMNPGSGDDGKRASLV